MASRVLDPKRLAVVARSGLVDSEREAQFDELTRAAAEVLGAPFAFITAVDDARSFWKSTYGIADDVRANSVGESFCQYVIETGAELIVDDTTVHPLTQNNPSIESMGVKAWAGYPVVFDDQVLGTFCVVDQQPRSWSEAERRLLRTLADVASHQIQLRTRVLEAQRGEANAVEQSERYRSLLETVRVSLLPPALPDIPGIELAAWFEPASNGNSLLGDFYDVFPLPGNRWVVAIGDVCGHGVEAAKLTNCVRYALRSAAIQQQDAADVMAAVDRALRADSVEPGRFATLCFLVIDTTASVVITIARAGHPWPIHLGTGDGAKMVEGASGPPVGLLADCSPDSWKCVTLELTPGSQLFLHTDGVTECRDRRTGSLLGEAGLLRLLDRCPDQQPSAHAIIEHARSELAAYTERRKDDVVILAVRATD